MIPIRLWAVLLGGAAALGACDKPPPMAKMSEALPTLPLPPNASFVERAGGPDVLKITVRSSASADAVAAYYRQALQKDGWHLMNDAKDAEGAVVLFAQQKGPPLWVRIQNAGDGEGSLVELSGAVLSKADTAPKKSS
jgi:hypothetical protein